jgi:hypothetical protein
MNTDLKKFLDWRSRKPDYKTLHNEQIIINRAKSEQINELKSRLGTCTRTVAKTNKRIRSALAQIDFLISRGSTLDTRKSVNCKCVKNMIIKIGNLLR